MIPKRSLAELRKLRKINEAYEKAMKEIAEGAAMSSISMIEKAIARCDTRVQEIRDKEEFLQKLETPKHERDADEILKKIRARADNIAAATQTEMKPVVNKDAPTLEDIKNLIEGKNND